MRKNYRVCKGKQFKFEYHDKNTQQTAIAVGGDLIEVNGNQVYVTSNGQRIHTLHYSWYVVRPAIDGIIEEIK